jgi:DNA-binding transcriptional LysR family regulator
MDRFQQMSLFVAVAEEGAFAAGARRLGLSAAAATRGVAALEQRLGVLLLSRSTRGAQPTDAGARFLDDCRRILAEVSDAEGNAVGEHAALRGHLVVAAPVLMGQLLLAPLAVAFRDAWHLSDRPPHLQDDGVDIALLTGALPDSSLIAIEVGAIRRVVCAAPSYLARHAAPATPHELADHRLVLSAADARTSTWRFSAAEVDTAAVRRPGIVVSTNRGAIEAVLAGGGITRVMSYQVADELTSGRLVRLLDSHEPAPVPVHVAWRAGRRAPAKVRRFAEFAVERLQAHPALH